MSGWEGDGRLTDRGSLVCRACHASDLASVLDLARQPLANELLPNADSPDSLFPLHLRSCRTCGLGQVGEFVLPERIFGDYPYLSSVSSSWLEHARKYAERAFSQLGLTLQDRVVEVASNDGYLLRQFLGLGVDVLGVEPAANVAAVAESHGVQTVVEFFGREAATRVLAEHGAPRLVVANNVLAHVPDLDDFVGGLRLLCGDHTMISVENPSYVGLLAKTQFDTIYHEHYSYLSAHAVQRLAARHDLELIHVEELPTHGGSYRYWMARAGAQIANPSVEQIVRNELAQGLLSPGTWEGFATRSRNTIQGLRAWLDERRGSGALLAGYGAAAKGNTLLNAAGATRADLVAVVDGSPEKQGKWLPGSRVPVVAPTALAELAPTDVLVLPWNLASEIGPLIGDLAPAAQCWTAIPNMTPISS